MKIYLAHQSLQRRLIRTRRIAICLFLLGLWRFPGICMAAGGEDAQLEASILLAKPAVVLISNEVAADVTVNCGTGPVQHVQPDPTYETGSGFIVHPDGYIATNGHVVTQYYEMNESGLASEFLERAVVQACGPALATVPDGARKERLQAIAADPVNRGKVQLFKRLQVHLSTGEIYAAGIKAYSPAIKSEGGSSAGKGASAGGKLEPERSGKDVAILKIDTHDLPTVRLASSSANLKLGEQIFVIGYPGVVLNHDFLSRKSQLEASVTVGRVSGFKFDLTNRRVIQTDASITWGNSGGPAFNLQGEVIGVATFISTTFEGDQAIQGFNFLIPVDSIREFARQIGVVPEPDTPFMREWSQGVKAYFAGEYRRSLAHTDAALRIMAGFPDIERLRADAQMRVDMDPRFTRLGKRIGLGLGAVAVVVLLAFGVRAMRRRRSL
jgi:serine protease Do